MEPERYTILHKIRETIYGDLYKGYDNKKECAVALKLSRSLQNLKRGEDPLGEISILEQLSLSPMDDGKQYIIQLHDKFSTKLNGIPYYCIALEYADGGDLLDKIMDLAVERRQLSFSQIRRYFVMLAKGLNFIHKSGISHLDLSLENILVTKTDEVRICDFGQAERKRTVQDTDLRRGKPKYMSPEVYRLEKYDGFKADIWSLGVVLWGMTTGGLLYKKPSFNDQRFVLLARGQEGINRLLELDEITDTPPSLVHLLSKMLDVSAENRYLIEDVLAHPWLNLNSSPKLCSEKLSKLQLHGSSGETKLVNFSPVSPSSKTLSPPRPLRSFHPSITTTPTMKTAPPGCFHYPSTDSPEHPLNQKGQQNTSSPNSSVSSKDTPTITEDDFVDIALLPSTGSSSGSCSPPTGTDQGGSSESGTAFEKRQTAKSCQIETSEETVTLIVDNKGSRVRTLFQSINGR